MNSLKKERARGRRSFRVLMATFVSTALVAGVTLMVLGASPASAASLAVNQCNGTGNGGGQTVACTVTVVNTLTNDPATTGSVVTVNDNGAITTTTSTDIVTSVTQCDGSENGGTGVLNCHINITNNIAMNGAAAPGAATINQCNANQPNDGLGNDLVNTCSPSPATTSGATITQCNGSGNGGGLVPASPYSHCTASGTVSASLPILVNQCNGSANGGGQAVLCSVTMTTNVVDTAASTTPTTTAGTGGTSGISSVSTTGVKAASAIVGTPKVTG
jgi:hypothetical protein